MERIPRGGVLFDEAGNVSAPPNPVRRRLFALGAAAFWIGAGAGYLVLEAIAAMDFRPHYSYARDYISDLGLTSPGVLHGRVVESPLAHLMNAAFYLQGISFLAGAILLVCAVRRKSALLVCLAVMNAVGNVLVGTIHSGPSAGTDGIAWLHAAGAVLAIVGGNMAVVVGSALIRDAGAARWYRAASLGLAGAGLLSFTMFVVDSTTRVSRLLPDGVWERGGVYSILAWQMLTAVQLIRARATGRVNDQTSSGV